MKNHSTVRSGDGLFLRDSQVDALVSNNRTNTRSNRRNRLNIGGTANGGRFMKALIRTIRRNESDRDCVRRFIAHENGLL